MQNLYELLLRANPLFALISILFGQCVVAHGVLLEVAAGGRQQEGGQDDGKDFGHVLFSLCVSKAV